MIRSVRLEAVSFASVVSRNENEEGKPICMFLVCVILRRSKESLTGLFVKTVLALKSDEIVLAIILSGDRQTGRRGGVMKANKALKRLDKIEALLSDVTERYSASAPEVREALQDAKAAVARAQNAVSSQASSRTVKTSKAPSKATAKPAKRKRKLSAAGRNAIQEALRRRSAQKKAATAKADRATKKTAPARKKTAVKKAVAKAPTAKTSKKRPPIKKAAKKTAPASVQAATESAAQEPMPAELTPLVPDISAAASNT
jgi:hypothetical protein